MNKVLNLWRRLRPKAHNGGRVPMNAIEIRSAILAVRINLDWCRYERDKAHKYAKKLRGTRYAPEAERTLQLVMENLNEVKKKAPRIIRSLERHLKRANSRLLAEMDPLHYDAYMKLWRAHVRWIRLHLVYFKPWRIGPPRRKTFYQAILTELEKIARIAIGEDGYEQPDAKELRRIMRLFTLSSRRGRQDKIDIHYMLSNEHSWRTKDHLVKFICRRLDLKRLQEN
jgi:hypothetical protein